MTYPEISKKKTFSRKKILEEFSFFLIKSLNSWANICLNKYLDQCPKDSLEAQNESLEKIHGESLEDS